MNTQTSQEKSLPEILNTVFELIPVLKSVYARYGDMNLEELFNNVLSYRTNEQIFPGFTRFRKTVAEAAGRIYGTQAGEETDRQLRQSSVLHTQVHLSLLRSFDNAKRLDENGHPRSDAHYNTLVLQSEILWTAMTKTVVFMLLRQIPA